MCVCVCVYAYMYVYTLCMYMCMYIYIYIYIYIYVLNTHSNRGIVLDPKLNSHSTIATLVLWYLWRTECHHPAVTVTSLLVVHLVVIINFICISQNLTENVQHLIYMYIVEPRISWILMVTQLINLEEKNYAMIFKVVAQQGGVLSP